MSKWRSYSYINLSAMGFDCLSSFACAILFNGGWNVSVRQVNGVYQATSNSFTFNLTFIPVADVGGGVMIRGDKLPGGHTGAGAGVTSNAIVSHPDLDVYANYSPYYNGNTEGAYVYQHFSTSNILAGAGCAVAHTMRGARFLRGTYTQNAAASYVPFSWDANTGEAVLRLETPVAAIKSNLKTIFEGEFHGNAFSLDDSQTPAPLEIKMNCPPAALANYSLLPQGVWDWGDPITAPLFKIDFI